MILKYQTINEGKSIWNYIDNVRSVSVERYDWDEILKRIQKEGIPQKFSISVEPADVDVENLPEEIKQVNEIYIFVSSLEPVNEDMQTDSVHSINNIFDACIQAPIKRILARVEKNEFEVVEIITPDNSFLLNENGATVDRI